MSRTAEAVATSNVEKAAGEAETIGGQWQSGAGRRQIDNRLLVSQTVRAQRLGNRLPVSDKQRFYFHTTHYTVALVN